MSIDLRIIYTIDLVADPESKYDCQVLKVFSVSTRARVSYDFWVKVSKYLARQGREYRDRCTRREYVRTADGSLNIPAMFDHKDYVLAGPDSEYSLEDDDGPDSETDMNELHEIVALEKFSPVTKSLYNSILADMEAVLPMALNPDERKIVRHHGTSVVIGRSGTGKTTALIYKMRANAQLGARSDELRPTRQLFVTRSKVLTQHIARNYQGLIDSSDIANKSTQELEAMRQENQKYQSRELVEYDNTVDLRVDLPRRFSELKDKHFPLFVSFDKLCELIEGDMLSVAGEDALTSARVQAQRIVSFSDFKHQYWPTFSPKLTRNLNPALVFSEILGVIKGYGRDLTMDETQKILSGYKVPPGSRVDYIFVDEVQDHLMSDVYYGGYWCGDTAQTINVGSSFRIKDLKAFIYENMIPQDSARPQRKQTVPFSLFELTVNFRSHGGIVRYAASLVELIYTLFPTSIDVMQPESAKTPGLPPLLFFSPENDEATFVHYLLDRKPIEQATPFGAQQAIIVRSESTARSLTQRLEKRCTVITLLETKGLEFDDILLYNFFAESEAPSSAWGAIFSLSVRNEDGRIQFEKSEPDLTASPVLCSELKQLYVAITRARHRCWIWDSGETIDAMRVLWEGMKLITGSDSLSSLSKFAASSKDLRQWAQRGQEFFSTGLYALAQSCFERAGQDKEAAIASAYQDMTEAKNTQGSEGKAALIRAADKMETCAKSERSSHTASTLWYHAATCWHAARNIVQASTAYCRGGFYDRAAVVSFEAQNMDECLKILVHYSAYMDPDLVHRIEEVASVHFLRERRYDDLQKLFRGDLKRCITLARSLRFPVQVKELLQRNRRFEDLGNEYLSDGLPVQAIECFLKIQNPSTIGRSRNIISSYLWTTFGFEATQNSQSTQQAKDLIKICATLGGFLDPAARYDIEIFTALIYHQTISIELFTNLTALLDPAVEEDRLRLTLIYHHLLKPSNQTYDSHDVFSTCLRAWPQYLVNIQLLRDLPSPSQNPHVRKLLGLAESTTSDSKAGSSTSISVPNGTFLQTFIGKNRTTKKGSTRDLVLSTENADSYIRDALDEYFYRSLTNLNIHLLRTPWTQPLSLEHDTGLATTLIASKSLRQSPDLFQRLDLVFFALDPAKGYSTDVGINGFRNTDVDKVQTAWLVRLFNVIFPATGLINRSGLEYLEPDFSAIHAWINKALELLDPIKHKQMFVTLLVAYLSVFSELFPDRAVHKEISLSKTKTPVGCPTRPRLFVADISALHQTGSLGRLHKVVGAIERIIDHGWSIDISVLVHLIERTTRDLILAERAITTWSYWGYSGLVVPLTWALGLVMHAKYPKTLSFQPIKTFVRLLRVILFQLLDNLPDHWRTLDKNLSTHETQNLTSRLIRTINLLAVNLHPSHPALPTVFELLRDITNKAGPIQIPLMNKPVDLGTNPDRLSVALNQRLCLEFLTKTFLDDELVMLLGSYGVACPAKHFFIPETIIFDNMPHLRSILLDRLNRKATGLCPQDLPQSANLGSLPNELLPESPVVETAPYHPPDTYEVPVNVSPSRPETPSVLSDSEAQDGEDVIEDNVSEDKLTPDDAASCIQVAWRRAIKRQAQRRRLHEFSDEGRLYEENRLNFPKVGKLADKRDILALHLVRGPCLSIVLGLQMLIEEMQNYLEQIDENLKAENLSPRDVEDLQKANKKNQKLVENYLAKANEYLPPDKPPKIIKPGNLSGVRTQTKNAWGVFMDVKNSKTVRQDEDFKAIEQQISYGRDVILKALELPKDSKGPRKKTRGR
ncbi:TPR and ankyrin repeat-containing protein 1 AltName: Full=Lupus brain antigen 1 homolog [Rhizoctonia solani AG-1 IB]|uniref:Rhizoctonia solani AG1-IB WGS project CAOJ00000000 data, isolate 7/3/14, contig 22334 n=1 Tax=Thanatephorus cucumeris (strain AG1-IB / isolate 7/3/14) TaxID=1108050 RepID=M5CB92_THACB|nr:TPR and ankyrin repeat-containing protein 1 AltName: Full=Lupus brain antigen 1 homolog [Rhizoctonia solani AG-1 IB]